MGWISIAALFFVIWWVTLFAAIPLALNRSRKEESSAAGASGAPRRSRRGLAVILLTTLIAGILVGALAVAVNVYGIGPDSFPQMIPE
jgi:predicted secreted protein